MTSYFPIVLAAALLAGTGCKSVQDDKPLATQVEAARETHNVGEVGPDGRIAIWVSKRGTFDVAFWMSSDYGVSLINEGDEKQPKALYVVASKAKKKVWQTRDLDEFRRLTKAIPTGSKVMVYDSCQVSLCYGLPEPTVDGFDKAIRRFGAWEDTRHITCVCDSRG